MQNTERDFELDCWGVGLVFCFFFHKNWGADYISIRIDLASVSGTADHRQ